MNGLDVVGSEISTVAIDEDDAVLLYLNPKLWSIVTVPEVRPVSASTGIRNQEKRFHCVVCYLVVVDLSSGIVIRPLFIGYEQNM